jgi:two-component system heavy metal sensor histidine kinase CusS
VSSNSIALRLSGMFTLVALLVFLLIGGALYQQVDKGLGLLPEAELDARYSVLESALNRYGTPEHWVINAKLKLLGEEDKRIRFWVVSAIPLRVWHPTRRSAPSPKGRPACATCSCRNILIR